MEGCVEYSDRHPVRHVTSANNRPQLERSLGYSKVVSNPNGVCPKGDTPARLIWVVKQPNNGGMSGKA
jgi:hypothetical protein